MKVFNQSMMNVIQLADHQLQKKKNKQEEEINKFGKNGDNNMDQKQRNKRQQKNKQE